MRISDLLFHVWCACVVAFGAVGVLVHLLPLTPPPAAPRVACVESYAAAPITSTFLVEEGASLVVPDSWCDGPEDTARTLTVRTDRWEERYQCRLIYTAIGAEPLRHRYTWDQFRSVTLADPPTIARAARADRHPIPPVWQWPIPVLGLPLFMASLPSTAIVAALAWGDA